MDTIELKKEQLKLAGKIVLNDALKKVSTIGGADCYSFKDKIIACVVVLSYPSLEFKEKHTFILDSPLPYIPTYEAYREMPALVEAFNKLESEPDILFVSGSGINHPRKIGLASHLGLILNQPTVGIAEQSGFGQVEDGKIKFQGEILGFEIRTREHSNPIYVSPGYKVTLGTALQLVSGSIKAPHKLPEPLHLARKLAKGKAQRLDEAHIYHNSTENKSTENKKTKAPAETFIPQPGASWP